MTQKIGKFTLPQIVVDSGGAAEIFSEMGFVPYYVECLYVARLFEYVGTSHLFNVLPEGFIVPEYKIIVFDGDPDQEDSSIVVTAELISDKVLMPKELTAENGAKGLLRGEFKGSIQLPCPECYADEDTNYECDICSGSGHYFQVVYVSWATIKEIYAMAVKEFGNKWK